MSEEEKNKCFIIFIKIEFFIVIAIIVLYQIIFIGHLYPIILIDLIIICFFILISKYLETPKIKTKVN